MVQSACIAESRTTAFPAHIFGEFCTPESEIVQEVLIPYLARALHKPPVTRFEEEVRNIHIVALGLIHHKNVIPELTPVIARERAVPNTAMVCAGAAALYTNESSLRVFLPRFLAIPPRTLKTY